MAAWWAKTCGASIQELEKRSVRADLRVHEFKATLACRRLPGTDVFTCDSLWLLLCAHRRRGTCRDRWRTASKIFTRWAGEAALCFESTGCAGRGYRFGSQRPCGGSQLSVIPVPADLTPSFGLHGYQASSGVNTHAGKHSNTESKA